MAERPVFIPWPDGNRFVREILVSFTWHKGMAPSQKKKNVLALHEAAALRGHAPLLEVSTKSEERLGQRLSAFNLKVSLDTSEMVSLESVYQGSKVFERGGPYRDLYASDSRDAKRDPRLQSSGAVIGYRFGVLDFPNFPKTAFYDWLYLRSLYPHRDFLKRLSIYAGFTDIEFNPERSINCQARSCATFVALERKGLLREALDSPESFIRILEPDSVQQPHSYAERQKALFG
ncbi:MAG: hypothetical protein DDT34_02530 [Firmicutes bacterium]|nr:hypothetical protein [Bacillota bacterium]